MNDDPLAPLCWPESRHQSGRPSGTLEHVAVIAIQGSLWT